MKRLLSVVAMLALAASLLPAKSHAGLRGAFDPITSNDDFLVRGKLSPALRHSPASGSGTAASPRLERWLAFVTLSSIVGSESVGEIWLNRNLQRPALNNGIFPVTLEQDPTGVISYIDPAWSQDGKWLAYVQTDNAVTASSIYVQQFDTSTGTDGNVPLGSPILVADGTGGLHHRHPTFNSNATQIAYDSDAFGPSIDLWTVGITLDATAHTGTVGTPVRHQLGLETDLSTQAILNGKAEFKPAYSPDNSKIAFVTNRFGVFQISILTPTGNGLGETAVSSENNPALVTHDNPSWAPDGHTLYYDAPSNEDPANPQDIWKLDTTTGQKCNIFIDLAGDVDPDISQYDNVSPDGTHYNYFVFISQAGGLGVQVWRGEAIQDCKPALPMSVTVTPGQIDVTPPASPADSSKQVDDVIKANLRFPAQTIAAGYVCRAANVGGDGIRMRRSIIASPTMMGLADSHTPNKGDCTNMDMLALFGDSISCFDVLYYVFGDIGRYEFIDDLTGNKNYQMNVYWPLRKVKDRIIALGLVNKYVGLEVRAYSNRIGQQFLGFGYIRLSKKNLAGSTIALQQNYPNPFNPVTKINFAVDKPGNVDVRVFNTRGELVRTVTNQWYPQGSHTVSWDGKTQSGGHAPSGIYYIRAKSGGSADVIKAVLAK
jgi:hypothetical protein